jgi:hypothetical protein
MGDNDTIKTARERALAEAERNAMEQGSYSYLESQTTVKNYQVTTDEIKSRVKGIITSKKILVDELEKESLRYHVRLEAEVKFADLNDLMKQHVVSETPEQDQPPQTTPVSSNIVRRRPSKQKPQAGQNQLQRLKREHPHRYIRLMSHIQPRMKDVEVLYDRFHRVKSRNPGAARDILAILEKTPVKGRDKPDMGRSVHFLRAKRPREYIHMMEILFPEVRPPALLRYWHRMREDERRAIMSSTVPPPKRR